MRQFYLTETVTKDNLIHQGIFYKPPTSPRIAILWVHGLTSNFYAGLPILEVMLEYCDTSGIGFASFNNRGHDFLAGARRIDKRKNTGYVYTTVGSGNEDFSKSVYDIDAGISYLADQGFSEVILIGSSTGANKVCYYAGRGGDERIKGVVLVSPISDRLSPNLDPKKMQGDLQLMRGLIKRGEGDQLLVGHHYFPLTPKRFVSLYAPGSDEDTFDYGDEKPKMKYFYKIKKPLLVLFGSEDEAKDRSVGAIRKVFDEHTGSVSYTSVIVKGASHNFVGFEKELVHTIFKWFQTL